MSEPPPQPSASAAPGPPAAPQAGAEPKPGSTQAEDEWFAWPDAREQPDASASADPQPGPRAAETAAPPPEAPSAPVRPADEGVPASPAAPSPPTAPDAGTPAQQDAGTRGGPPVLQWPLPKDYTNVRSGFGQRTDPTSAEKQGEFHPGIDIPAPEGVEIYAAAAGHVDVAREVSGYGNAVYIGHDITWSTRYAHASELLTAVGNTVKAGELIAKVGKTGKVTGPHLHFEVRENGTARDPLQYLTRPQ